MLSIFEKKDEIVYRGLIDNITFASLKSLTSKTCKTCFKQQISQFFDKKIIDVKQLAKIRYLIGFRTGGRNLKSRKHKANY